MKDFKQYFDNRDKLRIILTSLLVTEAISILFLILNSTVWVNLFLSGLFSSGIVAGKEFVADRLINKADQSLDDFYSACIGIAIALVISLLFLVC